MDTIFQVVDIWLNIIPYVDFRTFQSIKRLNKIIYYDCYIKQKPLIEDFKNWQFKLNSYTQNDIENISYIEYNSLIELFNSYLSHDYTIEYINEFISTIIPGDTVDILTQFNNKYPYKFYYNGIKFIKMNHNLLSNYLKQCDNKYIYPEHVLQFINYDITKFLINTGCLLRVKKIIDNDYFFN